jgi:leucyl/phenylalanyl-tRNA--protein transferase
MAVYADLHRRGVAHSVETWKGGRLVGGLYGLAIGGAFFGESMFSTVSDASKVALVHLVNHLSAQGFLLLDAQFSTPHLASFGTVEVSREEYLRMLATALAADVKF